jgi:hypothetical protein
LVQEVCQKIAVPNAPREEARSAIAARLGFSAQERRRRSSSVRRHLGKIGPADYRHWRLLEAARRSLCVDVFKCRATHDPALRGR